MRITAHNNHIIIALEGADDARKIISGNWAFTDVPEEERYINVIRHAEAILQSCLLQEAQRDIIGATGDQWWIPDDMEPPHYREVVVMNRCDAVTDNP
jgi:hypothetical protein